MLHLFLFLFVFFVQRQIIRSGERSQKDRYNFIQWLVSRLNRALSSFRIDFLRTMKFRWKLTADSLNNCQTIAITSRMYVEMDFVRTFSLFALFKVLINTHLNNMCSYFGYTFCKSRNSIVVMFNPGDAVSR